MNSNTNVKVNKTKMLKKMEKADIIIDLVFVSDCRQQNDLNKQYSSENF